MLGFNVFNLKWLTQKCFKFLSDKYLVKKLFNDSLVKKYVPVLHSFVFSFGSIAFFNSVKCPSVWPAPICVRCNYPCLTGLWLPWFIVIMFIKGL